MTSTQTTGRMRNGQSLEVKTLADAEPLGFKAADMNLYRYVGNNPTDPTDPTGLQPPGTPAPPGTTIVTSPFTPTIVTSPAWHSPMLPPSVLYVYDGQDPGSASNPLLANGNSFAGAVRNRGGDLLNMGRCANFTDFNNMINYVDSYTKKRGKPYEWIVFLDHGNEVVGQTFGNFDLGTLSQQPWLLEGPLGKLGRSTSNGFQFWGCLAARSSTTPLFSDLTGKPVKANFNESVSLTWGPYWEGGPFRWFYPPNWNPSPGAPRNK